MHEELSTIHEVIGKVATLAQIANQIADEIDQVASCADTSSDIGFTEQQTQELRATEAALVAARDILHLRIGILRGIADDAEPNEFDHRDD